jgi:hypothetical protein
MPGIDQTKCLFFQKRHKNCNASRASLGPLDLLLQKLTDDLESKLTERLAAQPLDENEFYSLRDPNKDEFVMLIAQQAKNNESEVPIFTHRNLSTRTIMFALVLQTFWAKKLVKSLPISPLCFYRLVL